MPDRDKNISSTDDHVTVEELDASLEYMLEAPTDAAPILTLCYRPTFGTRVFTDEIKLSPSKGVEGDRWFEHTWLRLEDGSPDPRNQVCIMGVRLLDLVWRDRKNTVYPGDTIIADMNFSEAVMPTGSRLKIGTCILEVSDEFNDACTKWVARYGRASRNWVNRPEHIPLRLRGILCQIIEPGIISKDSIIERL